MDSNTQATRIYRAIKDSGSRGIENYKLSKISLQYNARIKELREDGHDIVAVRHHDKNGKALNTYSYHLVEPVRVITKPTIFQRIRGSIIHA